MMQYCSTCIANSQSDSGEKSFPNNLAIALELNFLCDPCSGRISFIFPGNHKQASRERKQTANGSVADDGIASGLFFALPPESLEGYPNHPINRTTKI